MMRHVDFARSPAGDVLDGLIEWFWSVAWELPEGLVHDDQVLNHPAGNISIGALDDAGVPLDPAEGRVYGVMTEVSHRRLTSAGWDQLATVAGISVRTLQRLFDHHVGVSPSLVIRRWRIIEAAEAARSAIDAERERRGWATFATELGYADHAHLTRDFRRRLGTSPAVYLTRATDTSENAGRIPRQSGVEALEPG